MKKTLFLLLVGLLAVGALFAGGGPEKKSDQIIIGFNNGSTTVDFLRQVGDSMQRAADKYGVKLLVQGAQLIVDFNVNAEVGGSLVDYCAEKGVPVIGIDVLYTGATGKEGYFFGANNQQAGEVCGEGLADAINAHWGGQVDKYLAFFNSENGDLVRLRLSGMVDGMRKKGVQIADSQVEWIEMGGGGSDTTLVANQKMTDWLTAHPDLHHIAVGTVNTETGQGVFSAVESAGRDKDVWLATNNNGMQTLAAFALGDNCWLGGSAYYPTKYGDYIIPMAMDILAGKKVPRIVTMDHKFLTRADIAEIKAENNVE